MTKTIVCRTAILSNPADGCAHARAVRQHNLQARTLQQFLPRDLSFGERDTVARHAAIAILHDQPGPVVSGGVRWVQAEQNQPAKQQRQGIFAPGREKASVSKQEPSSFVARN
jgi:hypothetical protein